MPATSAGMTYTSLRGGGHAPRRQAPLLHLRQHRLEIEQAPRVLAQDVAPALLAQERQIVDDARQVHVPMRIVRGIEQLRLGVDHLEGELERLPILTPAGGALEAPLMACAADANKRASKGLSK